MDFNIFLQADQAAFEFEKAKRALELAKAKLEATKQAYEEVMSRAEESGVTKSKFKKIIDERVTALFESGLAEMEISAAFGSKTGSARPERLKKNKKNDSASELKSDVESDSSHDLGDDSAEEPSDSAWDLQPGSESSLRN